MSELLPSVRDHLADADLLDGYRVLMYRWTDSEGTPTIVFLRSGTGGASDYLVQRPDVRIVLVTGSASDVRAGEVRMHQILRYLRHSYKAAGVLHFQPMSGVIGPSYLENGRGVFELNIRCLTDDQ